MSDIPEGGGIVLTYHYCHPADAARFGGLSGIGPDRFRRQVDRLRGDFVFATAGRMLNGGADIPETACVITFDDGLRDFSEYALEHLTRWKVPATVFCCSLPLAEERVLDVQKIHLLQGRLGLEAFKARFFGALEDMGLEFGREDASAIGILSPYRFGDEETKSFKMLLNYELPYDIRGKVLARVFEAEFGDEREIVRHLYMSVDDLKRCRDEGVEIGIHSHSHPVLSRLDMDEQRIELETSIKFFQDALGLDAVIAAYPYGVRGTWNDDTKRVQEDLGVEGAFTFTGAAFKPADLAGRWEIPRLDVHDVFDAGDHLLTGTD